MVFAKRSNSLLILGATACALFSATSARADLYGLSSNFFNGSITPTLFTIDPTTGMATSVVTVPGVSTSIIGLGALNGTLYASDVFGGADLFGSIDPVTGAFTPISPQNGVNWWAITPNTSGNYFYVVDEDAGPTDSELFTITPSGTITPIAVTGLTDVGALAYDNSSGILYADSADSLYTIDTGTGTSTFIGNLGTGGGNADDMAIDPSSGILYLNQGDQQELYTVNTTTGAATPVGSNGVPDTIDGLAFFTPSSGTSSTPEPGALSLLTTGALSGAGLLWRRRRSLRHETP